MKKLLLLIPGIALLGACGSINVEEDIQGGAWEGTGEYVDGEVTSESCYARLRDGFEFIDEDTAYSFREDMDQPYRLTVRDDNEFDLVVDQIHSFNGEMLDENSMILSPVDDDDVCYMERSEDS